MPVLYETAAAEGIVFPHIWNQCIVAPNGYALLEIEADSSLVKEKGLELTDIVNSFLQKQYSSRSLREFLSSPVIQSVKTLILCLPAGDQMRLAVKGAGQIWLVRGKTVAPLVRKPGVLQGNVAKEDILFLFTGNPEFPLERLKEALQGSRGILQTASTCTLLFQTYQYAGKGLLLQQKNITEIPVSPVHKPKQYRLFFTQLLTKTKQLKTLLLAREHRVRIVAIIVGLLFIVSVLLGIQKQQSDSTSQHAQKTYETALSLFNEAVSIIDRKREESFDQLTQAQQILESVSLDVLPKGKLKRDVLDLKQKIQDNLKIASKINTVVLSDYFDASLVREGRVMDLAARVGDTMFFLDKRNGFLGGIALPTKNADSVVTSDDLINALWLSGDREVVHVLTANAVYAVTPQQTTPKDLALSFEGIGSKDFLATYGVNVYILDKQNRQLWRFQGDDTGISAKAQGYFAEGVSPDLSVVTSVAIDGSVWFGTTQGKVYKYTQGKDDPFLPRGLQVPFGSTISLYTSELTNRLYVLDAEKKRVVVLSKEGLYQGQYEWKEDILPSQIFVSEQQNRVLLLADKKLYSFTLQ